MIYFLTFTGKIAKARFAISTANPKCRVNPFKLKAV
jgi:hypothetical protein